MNVKLGKYNQLEVVKEVDFGVYLDGGDDGEILLPTRYVPEGCKLPLCSRWCRWTSLPVWKWHGLMSLVRF